MEKPIFDLLVEISKSDSLDLTDYSRTTNRDKMIAQEELHRKLKYLLSQGMISNSNDIYIITEYGFIVSQYDSWSDYLNQQKKSLIKREQKESLDLKISEFQVRTKFLPYYISLISVIISILALINPFEEKRPSSIKNKEIAKSKDSIITKPSSKIIGK